MSGHLLKIINAIFFYIIWWGCIFGIKYSYEYLGPLLAFICISLHLYLIPQYQKEFKLILFCIIVALLVEGIHLHTGLISYRGYIYANSFIPPLWIICIWIAIGTTLNYSMFFLKDRLFLMVLCGGIFGPLFYFIAKEIEIIYFYYSTQTSLLVLSAVWGISLPVMCYINKQIYKT